MPKLVFYIYYVLVYTNLRYSGAWLVASVFMFVTFGSEILQGLSLAAGTFLQETLPMKVEENP